MLIALLFELWNTYLGTATINVSMYSDSGMKSSLETTSANDRTARLPLEFYQPELFDTRQRISHVFFRCIWTSDPLARLYELSLAFMTLSIEVISCDKALLSTTTSPRLNSYLHKPIHKLSQPAIDRILARVPFPATQEVFVYCPLVHPRVLRKTRSIIVE